MKKIHLVVFSLILVSAPAWGGIKNSPHDLAKNSNATIKNADVDQTCVYCHTPHKADTSQFGPLWNRASDYTFNTETYYNSTTLGATAKAVTGAAGHVAMQATDAPLCLSCHDGNLGNAMVNLPSGYDASNFVDGKFPGVMSDDAKIIDGASLSNDHPIAFNYEVAQQEANSGLVLLDTADNKVKFFNKIMWCSSCHNVHEYGDNAAGTRPFLITSNNQSGLCLACHAK